MNHELFHEVEQFVHREARLADESVYAEWEELLAPDAHYWVPNGPATGDPAAQVSYINDNRSRIASRIRQLQTGRRHAQTPPSPMRRIVSNLEVEAVTGDGFGEADEIVARSNFVLYELAVQSTHQLRVWPGRCTHRLRRTDGHLLIAAKWVELVTAGEAQSSLTFLI